MNALLFHVRDMNQLVTYILQQKTGPVSSCPRRAWPNSSQLQLASMSFFMPDWCTFWLLAKDVLRLDHIRYTVCHNRNRGRVEKAELPVESLIKLTLFEGDF